MKLPSSVSPTEEDPPEISLQQTMAFSFPGLESPLEYPITLWTREFFREWTPDAYIHGLVRNDRFWSLFRDYIGRAQKQDMDILSSTTRKSHFFLLPYLRTGRIPEPFLRRCKVWYRHPKLYGEFPLLPTLLPRSMSVQVFLKDVLPLLSSTEMEKGIRDMIPFLDRCFEEAPSLHFPLVVYRGIKNEDFLPSKGYLSWKDPAYVSTTLHPLHAFRYKNPTGACCVQRLVIPGGCKVLLLQGISMFENEWEILLPRGLRFKKIREKTIQVPTEDEWGKNPPRRFQSVTVQEIRVYP